MVGGVIIIALLAIGAAIYLHYPELQLTPGLKKWREKGKFFTYQGHEVFFIDAPGNQEIMSAPLLVLHGYPTSSYDFFRIWETLQNDFTQVITLDFPGFGFSDKPNDINYSVFKMADIVETLLDYHGIYEVHILAHDMGDTVAQELLFRYKDGKTKLEIKSVCLLNGGIFPETNFPTPFQWGLVNKYTGPIATRLIFGEAFKFSFRKILGFASPLSDHILDDLWTAIRHKDGNLVMHKTVKYTPERRVYGKRWVGALRNTDVPVQIIYGPADPINPGHAFIPHAKKTVPLCQLVTLATDVGHYPQLQVPSAVINAYRKFLKTLVVF